MTLAQPTPEWMTRAACLGRDPELFFPDDKAPATYARSVCATCPVTAECLEFAVAHDVRHGVWGGLTSGQRVRRGLTRRAS